MYRIDITYTGAYGDTDPTTGEPCIVVTPDPDHVGTYIYSWITYTAELDDDEINGTITENWCGINTFVFNVYYGSENWDVFFPARTKLRLWSDKEQDFIFQGRVVNVVENMDSDGKLYRTIECESEMAYLCDSICDTAEIKQRLSDLGRGQVARDVLVTMLELHHQHTGGIAGQINKGFFPPNASYDDTNEVFTNFENSYPTASMANALNGDINTTYSIIQDLFVNSLGMDVWVSYNDSAVPQSGDATWTFGYIVLNMAAAGTGHISATGIGDPITITTNMKSLKVERAPTSDGRITRIVPLGGIGQDGQRLNVYNIDQYPIGWQVATHDKAVANQLLAITYGDIDKVSLHEDLVDNGNKTEAEVNAMIQELYRRGKAEADALSGGITSITVQAVDLYEAGYSSTHKFTIGDFHRISNDFFGLDDTFRLVRKITNLAEPWNAQLEFAKSQTKSTSMTANRTASTSNRIYNVENMIASRLDNSAVKLLSAAEYATMANLYANTVYYVDQGNNKIKAYLGNKEIAGGGNVSVGSAAILTDSTVQDFVVDRQVMIDYSPTTKVLYGASPAFCLINGVYCFLGAFNANNLQTILDHREYFGNDFSMPMYAYYNSTDYESVHKMTTYSNGRNFTSSTITDSISNKDYYDLSGTETTATYTFVSASNIQGIAAEWFVVPCITSLQLVQNATDISATKKAALIAAGIEYIPASVSLALLWKVGSTWYHDTNYRASTMVQGSSNWKPLWTGDEMDFAFGVSQRVEPTGTTP